MLAAVYHEFGGPIRVERVPKPSCRDYNDDDDDVVILQVQATGVCRSDWHGWRGHDADIQNHGLPFIPGHEVSGVVVETTACNNKLFQIGDRVAVPFILSCGACEYCDNGRSTVCLNQKQPGFTQNGSFAEFLAVPRASRNLCRIPEAVSFQQAAALGCRFTTAFRAVLQQGRLKPTESIAIFGCGGLGLSCIMLAKAHGCRTIVAVDVSNKALDKALELGATHALQILLADDQQKDVSTRVQEITKGGAHVVVEASGFTTACESAIRSTRRAGRMVQVGLVSSKPQIPMDLITAREIEIIGSHGFAASDLPDLLDMVASKKLDPAALIEREVTLEEGARAIEAMDHGSPLGITMITHFRHTSITNSRL